MSTMSFFIFLARVSWNTPNSYQLYSYFLFCRVIYYYLFIYRWQKMFYIALDKANWSQPKIEKSYIYIKA